MFLEPCSGKPACFPSVSPITTRAWDLVDDFASLYSWDRVQNVNQVRSQGRVGLRGDLEVEGVEPSGFWVEDASKLWAMRSPVFWCCGCAPRWTRHLFNDVVGISVTLKHFKEVGFFSLPCYVEYVNEKKGKLLSFSLSRVNCIFHCTASLQTRH